MMFGKPVTLEDHQNSRWIAEPLRLLDCTLDTDGAAVVIVTSAERAKTLGKSAPVFVAGAAQGTGSNTEMLMSYQRASIARLEESDAAAADVYRMAELTPADIETAQIYDHFTPLVLMSLESYGFAARGKAPGLFREGALELDGRWPMNTHGGHLGDGYLHGMSHIIEGVRQIRGTAVNAAARRPRTALIASGAGVPTSALILSSEDY
jgi:acetyl-CoA acetyltransferase